MANINIVLLAGNLTRDPEVRYTPSGQAVAKLGLAINRRFKDSKTNEMREATTFVDVDMWGRQAEIAGQYLSKGRPVLIEGRLQLDQWEDRNTGQKRSKLKVVANRFQFLGSGGQGSGGGGQPAPGQGAGRRPPASQEAPPPREAPAQGDAGLEIPEEEIPF